MYAERLKEIRKNLRFTIDEMAEKLGIKPRVLGSYERKERTPSIELGTHLCKKLNVNLNWFCTGEGEMFNAPQSPSSIDKDEVIKIVEDYLTKRDSELNR